MTASDWLVLIVLLLVGCACFWGLLAVAVWLTGRALYRRPPNRPQFNRPPAVARLAALFRAAHVRLVPLARAVKDRIAPPGPGRHRAGTAPRALEVPADTAPIPRIETAA